MATPDQLISNHDDFRVVNESGGALFLPPDESYEEWLKRQNLLRDLENKEHDRIVREVRVSSHLSRFRSLRSLVDSADELFTKIATDSGGQVVEHEWVLINNPGKPSAEALEYADYIPPGYVLAADTAVLRNVQPLSLRQEWSVVNALASFQGTSRSTDPELWWPDGHVDQFVSSDSSLWLVDIDPIIAPFDPKKV